MLKRPRIAFTEILRGMLRKPDRVNELYIERENSVLVLARRESPCCGPMIVSFKFTTHFRMVFVQPVREPPADGDVRTDFFAVGRIVLHYVTVTFELRPYPDE